jgi:hypothetical protein
VQQSDNARVARLFAESLVLFRELGDQRGIAECLEGWSALARAQGHAERVARLHGAAEALGTVMRKPLSSTKRTDLEHFIAALRAQLGEHAFAVAWAAGQALTLEQAVAEALQAEAITQNR